MGLRSSTEKPPINMEGEVANFVKEKIDNNFIMIFSKSWCPYCKTAKDAFEQLNEKYEVLELDKQPNGDEIQDILQEMTGARSVPRVFVGGKCIGGGSETKEMLKTGELKKLVEQRN